MDSAPVPDGWGQELKEIRLGAFLQGLFGSQAQLRPSVCRQCLSPKTPGDRGLEQGSLWVMKSGLSSDEIFEADKNCNRKTTDFRV